MAILSNAVELVHSRESRVPRISSEEVVAKVRVEVEG
jgi:hypothetical protein